MRPTTHARSAACSAALLLAPLAHAQPCGQCAWTQIETTATPSGRTHASMVYDEARDRLVLFGGYTLAASNNVTNETWEYDFATTQWILMNPAQRPSPRSGAAMVYDTQRQRTILFGGSWVNISATTQTHYNDTWEWDGMTWTQLTTAGAPSPRKMHAMVYDPIRDVVVLHGGSGSGPSSTSQYADTWEFNPGTGAWTDVTPYTTSPQPRSMHAMAFDPARGRPILFGGTTGQAGAFYSDTLEYQASRAVRRWVNLTNAGPNGRYSASMVADPARGRVLLYGGLNQDLLGDLWEWNGATATWTQLMPTSSVSPRFGYAWAFCTARGSAYLHGGNQPGYPSRPDTTWQLTLAHLPIITSHPTSRTVSEGGTALLRVQAAGTGLCYQWRRGGEPLAPSPRYLGVTAPTLNILDVHGADVGEYDVVVTNACGSVTSVPASLSLSCDANCDGSTTPPILDFNDFLCFQQKFTAGCP